MHLSNDLREFIELLNSTRVKYLLVGGHAVAYHGYPRFTGDIDFFVERSPTNAALIEEVLQKFGFGGLGLKAGDFLEPGTVIQLGRSPNRIDLVTSIDGVEFAEAWNNRAEGIVGGLPVQLIGKAELIRNKLSSARPQDMADAKRLQSGSID